MNLLQKLGCIGALFFLAVVVIGINNVLLVVVAAVIVALLRAEPIRPVERIILGWLKKNLISRYGISWMWMVMTLGIAWFKICDPANPFEICSANLAEDIAYYQREISTAVMIGYVVQVVSAWAAHIKDAKPPGKSLKSEWPTTDQPVFKGRPESATHVIFRFLTRDLNFMFSTGILFTFMLGVQPEPRIAIFLLFWPSTYRKIRGKQIWESRVRASEQASDAIPSGYKWVEDTKKKVKWPYKDL